MRKIQPAQYKFRQNSPCLLRPKIFMDFFSFWTKYIFLIITTAAWIMKIWIKLTSNTIVFKFGDSMLKTCRFTRFKKMPGYDGPSVWALCRSPRGSFDMRINYLSVQIILGYTHGPQNDTRRNSCSNFNAIGEKLLKLHCGEGHTLLKKITVGPARVSRGSFEMRINYLSMTFTFGHVFGA